MDGVTAQQGARLAAPASRQDVVSALLSAYGSSFDRGDVSPASFSPIQADKELPPPPPRVDSLHQKPLPSIQRAEQRMTMKFQLRVDEEAAPTPNGRRKIMYRSLSRGAKPPSLTLTVSNGSTAVVPPTPALAVQSQYSPLDSKYDDKLLPSPPPPPPTKSDRRPSAYSAAPGQQPAKQRSPLVRNDSLLSQSQKEATNSESAPAPAAAPVNDFVSVVKRKALPMPAVRKFRSLAELGAGPRGGKGGPLPPTSAPRKGSSDAAASDPSQTATSQSKLEEPTTQPADQKPGPPAINPLPPTPEDEKFGITSVPVPPRKAFTGMGLPSNPRAKGGPISPKHVRGKSSTGFNVLKAQRPAPPPPASKVEMITPEMTPSPKLKPHDEAKMDIISPVSPLPPPSERRPFSFEAIKGPEPASLPNVDVTESPPQSVSSMNVSVAAPLPPSPTKQTKQTQRPTSLDVLEPSPSMPSNVPTVSVEAPLVPVSAQGPAQKPSQDGVTYVPSAKTPSTRSSPSPTHALPVPQLPPSPVEESPTTPPPFTPLTRQPMPLPTTLIPAISPSQLSCYTKHSTSIWSNNTFQPMGCMICYSNDKDRKWTCTWCRVRICKACSEELCMVPGRDLVRLLEARQETKHFEGGESGVNKSNGKEKIPMPGIVVSVVEDVDC